MPEPRNFPRFLPRLGKAISVTFGEPLDHSKLHAVLDPWHERSVDQLRNEVPLGRETEEKRKVRCDLTDVIQREVEALGRQVSGPLLGKTTVVGK